MAVYSLLLLLVLVVGAPYWLVRMATSGRYRAGLAGRLGRVPAKLRAACAGKDVVWVHAVSVGEVIAASRLVEELKAALPGWVVAVSTTTETGQLLARQKFKDSPVFYLPLDFAWTVRRYLGVVRPKMLVLMESELWPRMLLECTRRAVPVAVVNARVSDRSFPRYMRLRRLWRPLLEEVSLFLAQSEETASRLRAVGAPAERVRVTGNLKYDSRAVSENAMTRKIDGWASGLGAMLVVAGSTLQGEEDQLLQVWMDVERKSSPAVAMLVIAPRHTDRFDEVFALIERQGYVPVRCSTLPEFGQGAFLSGNVVLLLDTIGDLASLYSLASVAFVGGSLVPKGGHNPLEPAQFGVPVMMGPSYENFRDIVETMLAKDAIRIVSDKDDLAEALVAILGESVPQRLKPHDAEELYGTAEAVPLSKTKDEEAVSTASYGFAMGERGRMMFEAQSGATARTVAALLELLPRPSSGRAA
jgi:3-deoxy-D-manno-octulosonic-acid transferase